MAPADCLTLIATKPRLAATAPAVAPRMRTARVNFRERKWVRCRERRGLHVAILRALSESDPGATHLLMDCSLGH